MDLYIKIHIPILNHILVSQQALFFTEIDKQSRKYNCSINKQIKVMQIMFGFFPHNLILVLYYDIFGTHYCLHDYKFCCS